MEKVGVSFVFVFLFYSSFALSGICGADNESKQGGCAAVRLASDEVATQPGSQSPQSSDTGLGHTEVVIPAAIAAGLAGLSILEDGLFAALDLDNDTEYWITRITLVSVHAPVYATDIVDALVASGTTAGLLLGSDLLFDQNEDFFAQFLSTNAFDMENLSDYMVFVLPIAGFIQPIVSYAHENAIWTTGKAYIGEHEMHPALAMPLMAIFLMTETIIIGVAEESHFHGFIYEEVGSNFGDISAKIVDALFFVPRSRWRAAGGSGKPPHVRSAGNQFRVQDATIIIEPGFHDTTHLDISVYRTLDQ